MTQTVNIQGVGTIDFPDGMSQADMTAAIQKNFPQIHNPGMTKQPGYQDSQTGAFTPIANAGQKAQAPSGSAALGATNGALDIGGGMVSSIPAGIAGVLGAIKGAVTPGENSGDVAQNWMQNTQDALNAPLFTVGDPNGSDTRGAEGAVVNAASTLSKAPNAALDAGYSKLRSGKPATAAEAQKEAGDRSVLDLVGNIAPMLLGAKLGPAADSASLTAPLADTPFSMARDAGYSIMPSEAAIKGGSAPMGKVVEGLAGSAKTGVDATVKNQAVTNRLAAQEIGAPAGAPLTDTVLDNLRKPLNAVYEKVGSLGEIPTDKAYLAEINGIGRTPGNSFPGVADPDIAALKQNYAVPKFDAGDAVLQIRNLRRNATANYKAAAANQVKNAPMLGELADAQQGIANALENQLERFAGSPADKVGNPALIQQWKAARQGLAKINTVDNAIKEGTTDVSAPALAKQLNKGAPLSGGLKTIADAANAFPISVRDIGAVRNKVLVNALEGMMGTGSIGAAFMGSPHLAAALATGMIARPLARKALLSGPYQDLINPGAKLDLSPAKGLVLPSLLVGNQQPSRQQLLPPWLLPQKVQ